MKTLLSNPSRSRALLVIIGIPLFLMILIYAAFRLYMLTDVTGNATSQTKQTVLPPAKLSITNGATKEILSKPGFQERLHDAMNKIYFVPNNGQYHKDVVYTFNTAQAKMLVYKDHLRMITVNRNKQTTAKDSIRGNIEKQIVDIRFPGAGLLQPQEEKRSDATTFNWFGSKENITNVTASRELRFKDVYSGIDLKLYSNKNGSLEFDWVVAKAEDYTSIQMAFEGQDKLSVDKNGNLDLGLRFGTLSFNIPSIYQLSATGTKVAVKGAFKLADDKTAVYALTENYKKNESLIIDPVLQWGTLMDANNDQFDAYLFGAVKDATGNIYLAGGAEEIGNSDILAYGSGTAGFMDVPVRTTNGRSGTDWLIMKINPTGSAVDVFTFFSCNNNYVLEQAHCLAISPSGNSVFVGGILSNGTLPGLSAGYQGNTSFGDNYISAATAITGIGVPAIAVFDGGLSKLKYRTVIGPHNMDHGSIASIEALDDNTFIFGATVQDLKTGGGGVPWATGPGKYYVGFNDIFIGKFTSFNKRVWGTYIGGDGGNELYDLRLTSTGNIAFCGTCASSKAALLPDVNTMYAGNNSPGPDATNGLVGVLKADGSSFVSLYKIGGSGRSMAVTTPTLANISEGFTGLTVGPCDTLFVTGFTAFTDFPFVNNTVLQSRHSPYGIGERGKTDAILLKIPSSGPVNNSTTTATYLGGSDLDIGNSIIYLPEGSGRLFMFGATNSGDLATANNIPGNGFYSAISNGSFDIFFLECSTDLKTKHLLTYAGGEGADYLGKTGSPISGKQTMLQSDSTILVATTTHSSSSGLVNSKLLSSSGVLDNTKNAHNKDTWIIVSLNITKDLHPMDAGDAPLSYGKVSTDILYNPISGHAMLTLGNKVDADPYYPPNPGTETVADDNKKASADYPLFSVNNPKSTNSTEDDEDALSAPPVITANTHFVINMPYYNNSGQNAMIYAYLDLNKNGKFDDAEIKISLPLPSNTSTGRKFSFDWDIPSTIKAGITYLRLVIVQGNGSGALYGCGGGLSSTVNGALGIGEIEDYKVKIISPLPVKWLSFDAITKGKDVQLNWSTTDEAGNKGFDILQSTDQQNWKSIAWIPAATSLGDVKAYQFTDTHPATGINYYRLKQVDMDGNFSYSRVQSVSFKQSQPKEGIYPNPAIDKLYLKGNNTVLKLVFVIDGTGNTVATFTNVKESIDVSALPPGAYFLKAAEWKDTRTFIKQ